jgi:hypothetical protein
MAEKNNQDKLDDLYYTLCTDEGRHFWFEEIAARAASKTLNTPIKREGAGADIGDGFVTLGANVAWHDDGVIQILAAVAQSVAPDADLEQLVDAFKKALPSIVKVNVSVEEAK